MLDSPAEHKPITLVIVEDNTGFQNALIGHLDNTTNLSLLGVAHSGSEALQLPVSLDPDIVLLDLHLPDQFGLQLIQPLLRHWPRAKVIVLSVDDDPRLRQLAQTAGATDFVSKMDAAEQLVPTLERWARRLS